MEAEQAWDDSGTAFLSEYRVTHWNRARASRKAARQKLLEGRRLHSVLHK